MARKVSLQRSFYSDLFLHAWSVKCKYRKEPFDKLNGKFFANFIREHFNLCFGRAGPKRNRSRKFVMDNDASQTSKAAMNALQQTESELLRIPARSGSKSNRKYFQCC